MNILPYTEIEHASESNVGMIALCYLSGSTLAIGGTIRECIDSAEKCIGERISRESIDDSTDRCYLAGCDLVAVEIGLEL